MTTHPQHSSAVQSDAANALTRNAELQGCDPSDEALISRQRQRYLASLLNEQAPTIDSQYREQ